MLENVIQTAAVAGQFYEANPERLRKTLTGMAERAELRGDGRVQAVIVPHAGYVFSGALALRTMALALQENFKRALVIAPSHRIAFRGIALPAYIGFQTPLGTVPVDQQVLAKLAGLGGLFQTNAAAHCQEHAIEVELPIWQFLFGDRPVVPLITGQMDYREIVAAGEALREYLTPDTLWIVSSDFTHYGRNFCYLPFGEPVQENLRALDDEALSFILSGDTAGFERFLARTGATICGSIGIEILMAAAVGDGRIRRTLVGYSNSGELTGDWSHCVSYAGVVFDRP